jgi:hypothetical protein
MVLDEQELRELLAAAADRASPPRFSMASLAARIGRRRARITGLAASSLLAVAAIAVAVPVALNGPSTVPMSGYQSRPAVLPFRLSFPVAVNGQSRVAKAGLPTFTVTPGERLRIRIGVTVPAHARVRTLWLGVSNGAITSPGPDGQRPASMHPVLARIREPLTPGLHTFRLTWTMPTGLPRGYTVWLIAGWTYRQGAVGQGVAELVTPLNRS